MREHLDVIRLTIAVRELPTFFESVGIPNICLFCVFNQQAFDKCGLQLEFTTPFEVTKQGRYANFYFEALDDNCEDEDADIYFCPGSTALVSEEGDPSSKLVVKGFLLKLKILWST